MFDGGHDADAGTHTVQQMGTGNRGFDFVGEPVRIGGEKNVRHREDRTPRPGRPHVGTTHVWGLCCRGE